MSECSKHLQSSQAAMVEGSAAGVSYNYTSTQKVEWDDAEIILCCPILHISICNRVTVSLFSLFSLPLPSSVRWHQVAPALLV